MKNSVYTKQNYQYIPNEKTYYFEFPISILEKYNGIDNLDVTIDDNLLYLIFDNIIIQKVEYKYKLNLSDEFLIVCIKVNEEKFEYEKVIDCLKQNKMINGLKINVENYGKLKTIYENKIFYEK